MNTFHQPVMVTEVIEGLEIDAGKKYIDATVGGGGHGIEILKRGGRLLGIDQDREAVESAKENIKYQMSTVTSRADWNIVQGNFRDIEKLATENGFEQADGILFDLGVSSHQIDTPERGFSFRFADAPLDLRMDSHRGMPASEYIKKFSEEELYEIFATFGEEKSARAIARTIVLTRRVMPLVTTGDLMRIIGSNVRDWREKMGTYARIFQALRILVNDELGALKAGLVGATAVLGPGGRMAVLSYHSLEDRMVKREIVRMGLHVVNKRPMVPSEEEMRINGRSRSAKLRIAQKL